MDKQLCQTVAEELGLTVEEVEEVIVSMEETIRQGVLDSSYDEATETRVLGFGSFITISDKAINKIKKY